MLNLLLSYVVCGRHLEFMLNNMSKVEINLRNGIPMPELVKIDLLFVKIAPQIKHSCSTGTDGGHFGKRCFRDFSPKIGRGIGAHF